MKKRITFIGIFVVLIVLAILTISLNTFGSKNWIEQKAKVLFMENGEDMDKSEKNTAKEVYTIQPLITEFIEESTSKGEWNELLKEIVFPRNSYIKGCHVESSKHPIWESPDFSYVFRVIIPIDEVNNFVNTLTERNFYSCNKSVIPSTFGEVDSENVLYTFERVYGLYNEGYRTSGIISIYMIDAGNDCIVLIQA